jgi:hypothetical protein
MVRAMQSLAGEEIELDPSNTGFRSSSEARSAAEQLAGVDRHYYSYQEELEIESSEYHKIIFIFTHSHGNKSFYIATHKPSAATPKTYRDRR